MPPYHAMDLSFDGLKIYICDTEVHYSTPTALVFKP